MIKLTFDYAPKDQAGTMTRITLHYSLREVHAVIITEYIIESMFVLTAISSPFDIWKLRAFLGLREYNLGDELENVISYSISKSLADKS